MNLAKYVQYLKEENKILRARMPGKQVHTKPAERERLLKYGRPLGRAIEELITIVSPATFYRWCKDGPGKRKGTQAQRTAPQIKAIARAGGQHRY